MQLYSWIRQIAALHLNRQGNEPVAVAVVGTNDDMIGAHAPRAKWFDKVKEPIALEFPRLKFIFWQRMDARNPSHVDDLAKALLAEGKRMTGNKPKSLVHLRECMQAFAQSRLLVSEQECLDEIKRHMGGSVSALFMMRAHECCFRAI